MDWRYCMEWKCSHRLVTFAQSWQVKYTRIVVMMSILNSIFRFRSKMRRFTGKTLKQLYRVSQAVSSMISTMIDHSISLCLYVFSLQLIIIEWSIHCFNLKNQTELFFVSNFKMLWKNYSLADDFEWTFPWFWLNFHARSQLIFSFVVNTD